MQKLSLWGFSTIKLNWTQVQIPDSSNTRSLLNCWYLIGHEPLAHSPVDLETVDMECSFDSSGALG